MLLSRTPLTAKGEGGSTGDEFQHRSHSMPAFRESFGKKMLGVASGRCALKRSLLTLGG